MITEIVGKKNWRGEWEVDPVPEPQRYVVIEDRARDNPLVRLRARSDEHIDQIRGRWRQSLSHKIDEYRAKGVVRITLRRDHDKPSNARYAAYVAEIGREEPYLELPFQQAMYCLGPDRYGMLVEEVFDEDEKIKAPSLDAIGKPKKPVTKVAKPRKPRKKTTQKKKDD
jgi:hypothetical protein